jgi:hypothetical protein
MDDTDDVFNSVNTLLDNLSLRKPCAIYIEFITNEDVSVQLRFLPESGANSESRRLLEHHAKRMTEPPWDTIVIKWFEEVKYRGFVNDWSFAALKLLEDKLSLDPTTKYLQLRRFGDKCVAWHRDAQTPDEARRMVLDQLDNWRQEELTWGWLRYWFQSSSLETQLFARHELKLSLDDILRMVPYGQKISAALSHSSNPFDSVANHTPAD